MLDGWARWRGGVDCEVSARSWSAAELRACSEDLATQLSRLGLRESQTVALMVSNSASFPVALMALLALDCNPLLLHAASAPSEILRLGQQGLGLRWAISDRPWTPDDLPPELAPAAQLERAPTALTVARCDLQARLTVPPLGGVVLHPTSGTSGRPRVCIRDQQVAVAEGQNYVSSIEAYDGIRVVCTTPLSHAFAYGFGLISALLTHSTLVLDRLFNPKKLLRTLTERPADLLTIVPPMAQSLAYLSQVTPAARLPQMVFYAGSRCDESVARDFEEATGARLYAIYGSTETGAISTSYEPGGCGTGVGHPLHGVQVQVRNQQRYRSLGLEGAGEVHVKASSMMQGYWGEPHSVAGDGWFPPGDVGLLDARGDVQLVGRTREMINVGGLKVDPGEVESVLLGHPDVRDVAVYPGQGEAGNEMILAAVQGAAADPNELKRHCAGQLAAWKVPTTFHEVQTIPRTPSGKCLKYRLPGCLESMLPPGNRANGVKDGQG